MDEPTKHVLSASKIETYQKCSLVYYAKYINKTPDKENYGALRGTICHDIFEMLIQEKYKKRVKKILDEGSILKDKDLVDLINSKPAERRHGGQLGEPGELLATGAHGGRGERPRCGSAAACGRRLCAQRAGSRPRERSDETVSAALCAGR